MTPVDYNYSPTDDELRAYAALTPLERLKRLDDLRLFILMLREAPIVHEQTGEPKPK